MFHIEYNGQRGFFSWEDVRCLSRALGFPPDVLVRALPQEFKSDAEGLTVKDFLRISTHKYLDAAVDKTFNAHSADWNLCVLRKGVVLINYRVLSFQELNDIRMAYGMYEHQDLKGLELNETTLLRCLKMCGRMIAPLKMEHRIKHMSLNFDEEGRIQLYEFLDLVLWTELYDSKKVPTLRITKQKKKDSPLYEVDDFVHITQHYDERLENMLNELYLHEEWSFSKETFSKQKLPNELPVNRDFRLNQMKSSKQEYKDLKREVSTSQKTLHLASTGHVRPRPLSAPNIEKFREQSEKSSIYTSQSQHKITVGEMIRDYMQHPRMLKSASPTVGRFKFVEEDQQFTQPVLPAVTHDEAATTQHLIEDLTFRISTLGQKYECQLVENINRVLPHYSAEVKKEMPVEPPSELKAELAVNPALTVENINRLAYSPYRPAPKPSHAKQCDARLRGWHKTRSTMGKHYILATTSFGDSPGSQLLGKLQKRAAQEVRKVCGDFLVRKTTEAEVRPEISRPVTAPATMHTADLKQKKKGVDTSMTQPVPAEQSPELITTKRTTSVEPQRFLPAAIPSHGYQPVSVIAQNLTGSLNVVPQPVSQNSPLKAYADEKDAFHSNQHQLNQLRNDLLQAAKRRQLTGYFTKHLIDSIRMPPLIKSVTSV